jgi:predicted esterase
MGSRAAVMVLAASAAFLPAARAGDPAFPDGVVIDRVACADSPAESYALFLPPGFGTASARTWPILYLFDARARGPMAAKLFAAAAAREGFILASSNDTESDGAMDPNVTAFRAMWRDTHARFAIDPRRVYAGGFSGGARIATLMASTAPGAVAGVIGCGAGFHAPPAAKPPFAWFGAVGNRDFNYDEMRELDATLARLGAAHHVETFDGDHGWPPADVCSLALEWMQLQAERAGAIPADPERAGRLMRELAGRAEALAAAGRTLAAMNAYARAAADFRGTDGVAPLEEALAALERSPAGARARREEQARIAGDDAIRERFVHVWGEIRSGEAVPEARLRQELGIAELRERAARSPGSEEALGAERLLSEIFVQTVFYLPRGYRAEKNWNRAILCAGIAADARPDSPLPRYELAALHALSGRPDRALEELDRAAALGYRDAEALERDPDFAALRSSERFQRLLAKLRERTPS